MAFYDSVSLMEGCFEPISVLLKPSILSSSSLFPHRRLSVQRLYTRQSSASESWVLDRRFLFHSGTVSNETTWNDGVMDGVASIMTRSNFLL